MFQSIDYRYPTEYQTLWITLGVMAIAIFLFVPVTLGTIIVILGLGFALNYLFIRARIEGLKRNAVRVSASNFQEIKAIADQCAQRIGISPDTDVFVSQSPTLNAFATGIGRPYSIVITSSLVHALDHDELTSVIGHEMGHIKFGHTTLLTLVGQLGSQTFGIPLVGDLIRYTFLFWMRATEFTADRAGLVACGNLDKAIMTEVKLGVGPDLAHRVNLQELIRQAIESRGSILGTLGEMEGDHPMMTSRIQKIIEFATSDIFRRLRPDISVTNPIAQNIACPNCGQMATSGATFCAHCGTRLVQEPRVCSNCGQSVQTTWKVCIRCGNALS